MIKIAFCDDNELQLEILTELLTDYANSHDPDIKLFPFRDGLALLDSVESGGAYDIYVLDMLMPFMNGLEVAESIRNIGETSKIIFLTASSDHAADAFDVEAFGYLLKPLDPARMFAALDAAIAAL